MEWPIWRIVLERMATLEEIERHWSLDDVARMNALLDMKADIKAAGEAKVKP